MTEAMARGASMPARGLYVVVGGAEWSETRLAEQVAAALRGGACLVQYRDKHSDADARARRARILRELCDEHGVALIVNDDVALARAIGSGVHLGRDDTPLRIARTVLGTGVPIGVSCYDSLARARRAAADGADYVAFGRFFPSQTKPQATPAPVDLLRRARAQLDIPIVAIGGITPENGAALIAAGADLVAVSHGVFGAPDVAAAARRYTALYAQRDG